MVCQKTCMRKKKKTLNIYNKILAVRGRSEFCTFRDFRQNFKVRKQKYVMCKLLNSYAFCYSICRNTIFPLPKNQASQIALKPATVASFPLSGNLIYYYNM